MKRFVRTLSLVLALTLALSCAAFSAFAAEKPFTDVKSGAWYESAVETVYSEGIMEGKAEGKFAPNAQMTRAELVTVLCRLSGEEAEGMGEKLSYTDTKKTAWYADSVAWAAECELVTGYPDGSFKPNAPILRQELAKLIVSFLEHMNVTEKGTPLAESFTDTDSFPKWAAEFIEKLRETGLVGGDDSGAFNPKNNASRAEIATVITRLLPLMETQPDNETDPPVIDPPVIDPENFDIWKPGKIMRVAEKQEPFYTSGNNYTSYLNWRLYVPDDYNPAKKYPVLLFLHGAGESGTDNTRQLTNLVYDLYNQMSSSIRDTICIYPQTPGGWKSESLHALMEHAASLYSTDPDRYYVVGLSMGGHGTWDVICEYPDYFAAAVPICGAGNTANAPVIADMPIYIVHGAKDDTVPVSCSRDMYKALKAAGSTAVIYEELPDYNHDAWNYVGDHEEIMVWMFKQTRKGRK